MGFGHLHLHTDNSNVSGAGMDSVTDYLSYIAKAKECGQTFISFSEHGNRFQWVNKKEACDRAGIKCIDSIEAYVTEFEDPENKIRDNYHILLIARNWEGVKELNRLSSGGFNRGGWEYYYAARISLRQLMATSENIIICTACLGGILCKGSPRAKELFLTWAIKNKHRVFLEVQPHLVQEQADYNKYLFQLSTHYGFDLVATTDVHSLDSLHAEARAVMQRAKDVSYPDEDACDLVFKTEDEMAEMFYRQEALPQEAWRNALANSGKIADMCEPYELDYSFKFPKVSEGDSSQKLKEIAYECYKDHPYLTEIYRWDEIEPTIDNEIAVINGLHSADYMMLEKRKVDFAKANGIKAGFGRGSVAGSFLAFLLGITEVDPLYYKLNFGRFLNLEKVSLPDIDSDYAIEDKRKIDEYILKDHMGLGNLETSQIITFNTLQLKAAIKDVGRGLGMTLEDTAKISNAVERDENMGFVIADEWRELYPDLFKYVDVVKGKIVSVGTHPSGNVITDRKLDEEVGTCTLATTPYLVSQLCMDEISHLNLVKLDILALDTLSVINQTCKLAGIKRPNPSSPEFRECDDMAVWRDIMADNSCCFQFESNQAANYIRKMLSNATLKKVISVDPDFRMIDRLAFASACLRPSSASYRDSVADGEFFDNGSEIINDFLKPTQGHLAYQEQTSEFLMKYCGFDGSHADTVRRAISKKKGTESLLPMIEQSFVNYSSEHYGLTREQCADIIKPFLQTIQDAARYQFGLNHSMSYALTTYVEAYLRYYHTLEFCTACLNVYEDKPEKTAVVAAFAKRRGIEITNIRFRESRSGYSMNRETNSIAKGIASIKYMNGAVAEALYGLRDNYYGTFTDLLYDIRNKIQSINSRQIEILIKLGYFEEFGEVNALLMTFSTFGNIADGRYTKNLKMDTLRKRGFEPESVVPFAKKVTEKTLMSVDLVGFLRDMESRYKKNCAPRMLKQRIADEIEFVGYVTMRGDSLSGLAYVNSVANIGTKMCPRLELTSLKHGNNMVCKIMKSTYRKSEKIAKGDILRILHGEYRPKAVYVPETGTFKKDYSQKEYWITGYQVYKDA